MSRTHHHTPSAVRARRDGEPFRTERHSRDCDLGRAACTIAEPRAHQRRDRCSYEIELPHRCNASTTRAERRLFYWAPHRTAIRSQLRRALSDVEVVIDIDQHHHAPAHGGYWC